jgi:hypothetical protein
MLNSGKKQISQEKLANQAKMQDNPIYWKDVKGNKLLTKDAWLDDLYRWFRKHNEEVRYAKEKEG